MILTPNLWRLSLKRCITEEFFGVWQLLTLLWGAFRKKERQLKTSYPYWNESYSHQNMGHKISRLMMYLTWKTRIHFSCLCFVATLSHKIDSAVKSQIRSLNRLTNQEISIKNLYFRAMDSHRCGDLIKLAALIFIIWTHSLWNIKLFLSVAAYSFTQLNMVIWNLSNVSYTVFVSVKGNYSHWTASHIKFFMAKIYI